MRPDAEAERRLVELGLSRGWITHAELSHAKSERDQLVRAGQRTTLLQVLGRRLPPDRVQLLSQAHSQLISGPAGERETLADPDAARAAPGGEARTHIGPYELRGELARGGMGIVYRAWHPGLEREVALKVLLAGAKANPKQIARFHAEARSAARLRHPNIVAIHDVGESNGQPYFVMDLIQGEALDTKLEREGPMDPRQAAELAEQIALALYEAHTQAVIHRDMKPANVLITEDGQPVVTDFGLAKEVDREEKITTEGQFLGTPAYMPPEQARGQQDRVDRRSDVYSLGATLHEMLTGRPPFDAETAINLLTAIVDHEPDAPSKHQPGIPRDLDTIVLECLHKEPEERYASARDLARDLRRFLNDQPIVASPPTARDRWRRWVRRNRGVASVLLGTLIVLVAAGVGGSFYLVRAQAEAKLAESEARQSAASEARAALAADAQAQAEAAWRDYVAVPPAADAIDARQVLGVRTGLALGALQAAGRWHTLAPESAEAGRAMFQAAFALGDVAQQGEQWVLATQAYEQAAALGVDDAAARASISGVGVARDAEAERRRVEISALLDACESGALGARADGVADAVFWLVRYPETQTVELVAERLDTVTARLSGARRQVYLAAREPTPDEVATGSATIPDLVEALDALDAGQHETELSAPQMRAILAAGDRLEARARARIYARTESAGRVDAAAIVRAAQLEALGPNGASLAALSVEALGRLGIREGAVEALGRYLRSEYDEHRAVLAGLALSRLGGQRGQAMLEETIDGFGLNSVFAVQVGRAMGRMEATPELEGESAPAFLRRAESLYRRGEHEAAEADCTRALELDATIPQIWIRRAMVRAARQNLQGALSDLEEALRLDDTSAKAWANLGVTRFKLGDRAGALADYERALTFDPTETAALSGRGVLRFEDGAHELAEQDFSAALRVESRDSSLWSHRGMTRRAMGDQTGALADYDRALELDPRRASTWNNRALTLVELGRHDQALAAYDRAIELEPRSPTTLANRALLRVTQQDLSGAIADLSGALQFDAQNAELWETRGTLLMNQGKFAEAVADLGRALELNPDSLVALNNRALIQQRMGQHQAALADMNRVLELAPNDGDALNNRGNTRRTLGDLAGARSDFDRVIALRPNHPAAYSNRALVNLNLGDLQPALRDALRTIELAPNEPQAYYVLGSIYRTGGDPANANRAFDQGLALDPNNAAIRFERSVLRRAQGDLRGAIEDATVAIRSQPQNAFCWYARGSARYDAGDPAGAIEDATQALRRQQGLIQAWLLLGMASADLGRRDQAVQALQNFLQLAGPADDENTRLARAKLAELQGE